MRHVSYWLFPKYIESLGFYLTPFLFLCMAITTIHRLLGMPLPLLTISFLAIWIAGEAISVFSNIIGKKLVAGMGLFITLAGDLMNFTVITLNNWRMPVVASLEEFLKINNNPSPLYIHFEQSNQKLLWLSEWMGNSVIRFSPGDIFILVERPSLYWQGEKSEQV